MRIFIDTSPFIYLVEGHPAFADPVKTYILNAVANDDHLVTSVITIMEYGVMPTRKGKEALIHEFDGFIQSLNIPVEIIDRSTAVLAYKLRGKYEFLKGMDALQLAVAIETGCELFITNDKKLKNITEIQVLIVEDL
ncbi:MAG: PIN domain-containing protein [Saprospiraceae bacterium]|jgi:predicted nucleic acid-binding protein|nr:PIN domain-containing protein [Saprospiraceae bacterium]